MHNETGGGSQSKQSMNNNSMSSHTFNGAAPNKTDSKFSQQSPTKASQKIQPNPTSQQQQPAMIASESKESV